MTLTITGLEFLAKMIWRLLKLFKGPFLSVAKIFFRLIIIPFFGRYLLTKNKIAKKTSGQMEKVILLFSNRYIVHVVVIVISLFVVTSNIFAYGNNEEDYGQGALIYDLVGVENLEIIEDSTMASEEITGNSYLEKSSYLSRDLLSQSQMNEDDIYQGQYGSELAMTEGGSTLVKPDLASTEAAKITKTSIQEYIVKEGDSIGAIATSFNISVNTILWANNLSSTSYIKPGQKLIIPPTSGVIHTVKKGDTIKAIAQKYEATADAIKDFNNIDDELLVVGDILMVPGGRVVYTAKPRTYSTPAVASAPTNTAPAAVSSSKLQWPSSCRRITQYYRGWLHTGLDIACGQGKPIYAAEDGIVTRVQYLRTGYGYNVTIDHGGGTTTLYGHASQIYVKVGDKVSRGQVIMAEGTTGRSTGPHLHFEVRINGSRVNPLNYIR